MFAKLSGDKTTKVNTINLAIAGLKAKDIMGYCLMLLIITGVIISIGLTWL